MKPANPNLVANPGPSRDDIAGYLKDHRFLEGLSPHQYRVLGDCSMVAHFAADELIFRAGDPANRFYLIRKGKVSIECFVKDRGNTPIQTIGAGEVLGWSWLFPPYFWHFNARALEATEALFIYGTPLREECENDHELGYELMKRVSGIMLERLQATRRQLFGIPSLTFPK